jgi:hypothetical protein
MRRFLSLVVFAWLAMGAPVLADEVEEGWERSGYGASEPSYQHYVAHDGYGGVGVPADTGEAPTYVVVEMEAGTATEYEGEPILVVKEPDPVAATSEAPPPPRVVPSDEVVLECPSGVWVNGYWDYRGGRYFWVDGHCVEVRVNYVFVAPRWDFYWDIWWFIPGYYRPCGVFVTYGYYRPWHWFPPYPYPYYHSGRAVPAYRGVPTRHTVARPVSSSRTPGVTPAPRHPTSVVDRTPSGSTRPVTLGRAGTGPVLSDQGVRTRHGVQVVSEPRPAPRSVPSLGARTPSRPRGLSGRPRARPSSGGSVWTPSSGSSSGSSRGVGGGRTRSTPSSGSSSSGSSSGGGSRGLGGKHK